MTKVIYIMGAARSGSTIVGVALGNCLGAFYAGELDLYPALGGTPTAPGERRAEFWSRVRRQLARAGHTPKPQWRRWFEHPSSLANGGHFRSARAYRAFNAALFQTVATEARSTVVVDSSHHPLRRLRLGRHPSIGFCTLYLVRDPVGVVRALETDISPKSWLSANAYVWCVYTLAEIIFLIVRTPKLRIRFEDFVADPAETTRKIAEACPDLDTSAVDYDRLCTGLPLAGNRLIREASVGVRAGVDPTDRDITRWLQLPWRLRYGYR
jgi:sulfotransferase family protein